MVCEVVWWFMEWRGGLWCFCKTDVVEKKVVLVGSLKLFSRGVL